MGLDMHVESDRSSSVLASILKQGLSNQTGGMHSYQSNTVKLVMFACSKYCVFSFSLLCVF